MSPPNQNPNLRPLNQPSPIAVEADDRGVPKAVLFKGIFQQVAAVNDTWRIDDEWWRDEIARRYFAIELQGGNRRITIYHDLVRDLWYEQTYESPKSSGSPRRRSA